MMQEYVSGSYAISAFGSSTVSSQLTVNLVVASQLKPIFIVTVTLTVYDIPFSKSKSLAEIPIAKFPEALKYFEYTDSPAVTIYSFPT